MSLSVRKVSISAKSFTSFILYFTVIMEILIAQFNLPGAIRYLNDGALILILIATRGRIFGIYQKHQKNIFRALIIFIIGLIISIILNFVPLQLIAWATRNTFRGIVYFYAVSYCMDSIDVDKIMNKLLGFQALNVVLSIYQFAVLHNAQDEIGGIFGHGNGAGVNTFNFLLFSYFLNKYLDTKKDLWKVIYSLGTACLIAAIAEEKATYVFVVLVLLVSVFASDFSFRKIGILILGVVIIFAGLQVLNRYYPDMYENLINAEQMIEYISTTYEEGYRIPRLGAFSVIADLFFEGSIIKKLFGIGFGNGEYSTFSFLTSSFYEMYGSYNYRWFMHQWMFLETGYVGFLLFLLFFITIVMYLMRGLWSKDVENKYLKVSALANTFACIIGIWYNATLKTDMCYIAYFAIAIGFVATNKTKMKTVE